MSSDNAFIAYLVQIQTNFYRIGGPILMVIGTLSCILSFMVFMRKNLRKNPCSIYLMAVNVSNILLIFTSISLSTLAIGYKIDPSLSNLRFCRFRYYVMFLFDILGPSYLILAAIDRVLLTSPNALTRQRSTPRLAYTCIIIATVFWTLMHLHAAIVTDIVQIRPGVSLCFFPTRYASHSYDLLLPHHQRYSHSSSHAHFWFMEREKCSWCQTNHFSFRCVRI